MRIYFCGYCACVIPDGDYFDQKCNKCHNIIPTMRERICGYFMPAEARRIYGHDTSLIEECDEDFELEAKTELISGLKH